MAYYTFSMAKIITATVEADTESEARDAVVSDIADGEYSYSFDRAEVNLELIDAEDN